MTANTTNDGVQYDYQLTVFAFLLNPPELLIYRVAFILIFPFLFWGLINEPSSILLWFTLFMVIVISWGTFFRKLFFFSAKQRTMSFCITKNLVALQTDGRFYSSSKKLAKVRRGLAGTYIVSTSGLSYYLISSKNVSFEVLKSQVESYDFE